MIRSLNVLLLLASVLAGVAFFFLAARRLDEPRPLDPIEGAVLEQAQRIAHGVSPYAEPAEGTLPSSLMPGLPLAVAPLVQAFGPHVWEPRVVSLLALLAAAVLVAVLLHAETGSVTIGVAGAGLMFAGFTLLTTPHGAACPEALMLALVLGGFATLRFTRGIWGALAGAVVLACAYFTLEVAAWFIAGALVYFLFEDRKRAAVLALALALLCGGGFLLLSWRLGLWFNYSAWDLPLGSFAFDPWRVLGFMSEQLLGKLGVLTFGALLSFALPVRPWRGPTGIWMCAGLAALGAGLLSSQISRPGPGALMPTLAAFALLGPLSLQRVARHLATWPGSSRLGGTGIVLWALVLQFVALASALPPSLRTSHAGTIAASSAAAPTHPAAQSSPALAAVAPNVAAPGATAPPTAPGAAVPTAAPNAAAPAPAAPVAAPKTVGPAPAPSAAAPSPATASHSAAPAAASSVAAPSQVVKPAAASATKTATSRHRVAAKTVRR